MTDAPRIKITYATLRADNEELHTAFEEAVVAARARLGQSHPNVIGGQQRAGDGEFELRSPIDQEVIVGHFAKGTREDVQDAAGCQRGGGPHLCGRTRPSPGGRVEDDLRRRAGAPRLA